MASGDVDFDQVKRHLAANLARLRARRGWSQQKVADEAGLDLKHVQKLEYGALNPSLLTLVRLAQAFDVGLGRLVATTKASVPKRPVGRPRASSPTARKAKAGER